MPLSAIQKKVFRLLREHRNPDSHVAGASALHADPGSPRYSEDIDIFHDVESMVAENAEADAAVLTKEGFSISWQSPWATMRRAWVECEGEGLKMEWAYDSAFRFFPAEPDPVLGYRLHRADLAVNKILAAAGRQVARDYLDLMFLHETYLTIGALAWAATGKDPGMSPLFILNELVRTNRYRPEDFSRLQLARPVSVVELKQAFRQGIAGAEDLINRLPQEEVGCLYLDSGGQPVTPDPASQGFSRLTRHYGMLRGSWPRIVADD